MVLVLVSNLCRNVFMSFSDISEVIYEGIPIAFSEETPRDIHWQISGVIPIESAGKSNVLIPDKILG